MSDEEEFIDDAGYNTEDEEQDDGEVIAEPEDGSYEEPEDYDVAGDPLFDDAMDTTEKEELNYKCLTPEDIVKEQSEHITKVAELFAIPESTAKQLLTHMKWNRDRLIERYYEGEAEQIFKESGIEDPNQNQNKKYEKLDENKVIECTICLCDYPGREMAKIGCGHVFCNSCWYEYLKVKIMDGIVTAITCPASNCTLQLDEVSITRLINHDDGLKEKYNSLVAQAYVNDNKNVRWCPGKGCQNAVRVQLMKEKEVICTCGTKFCFGCGELPHAPADCKMIKEWLLKCSRDGDDAKWIASFTKECPSCQTLIHKDGGCQYMSCNHCNHKFCWMCLGAFDHKDHSCNKYKEEQGVDPNSERSKLNKYMFFYTRYMTHQQSIDLESKLKKDAEKTMKDLADKGFSWIDVQFIKQATQALMECRNMLKYTYVYGYFLPKHVNRSIFEYLQTDLEAGVERLSGLLEASGDKDRLKVINASEYVRQRQKNLLQGLAEGDITGKGGGEDEKMYKNEVEVYDGWVYNAGS